MSCRLRDLWALQVIQFTYKIHKNEVSQCSAANTSVLDTTSMTMMGYISFYLLYLSTPPSIRESPSHVHTVLFFLLEQNPPKLRREKSVPFNLSLPYRIEFGLIR